VLADLRKRLSVIQDANVLTIPPPPVQGLGSAGGFKQEPQAFLIKAAKGPLLHAPRNHSSQQDSAQMCWWRSSEDNSGLFFTVLQFPESDM
jgi:hypothetical protein